MSTTGLTPRRNQHVGARIGAAGLLLLALGLAPCMSSDEGAERASHTPSDSIDLAEDLGAPTLLEEIPDGTTDLVLTEEGAGELEAGEPLDLLGGDLLGELVADDGSGATLEEVPPVDAPPTIDVAEPGVGSAPTFEAPHGPWTPEEAVSVLVLDACSVVFLPPTLLGLVTGIGGAAIPIPIPELPAIGPLIAPLCVGFGFPRTQTICPYDRTDLVGFVPPPLGRAIDLVEGMETAFSPTEPTGLAQALRDQIGCQVVPYP